MKRNMTLTWTRRLLFSATLLGAILAGITVDRYFIQRPAFEHLGMSTWGAYSRLADLSPRGLFLYPLLGIGNAIFIIAAAVMISVSRIRPQNAVLLIYCSVLLVVGGLAATLQAAPIMLSVAKLDNDHLALQRAFDGFFFWSAIRGSCQVLAFVTSLLGLVRLYGACESYNPPVTDNDSASLRLEARDR